MMEQDNYPYDYAALIFKHFRNELREDERQQLEEWLAEDERRRELLESFMDREQLAADVAFFEQVNMDADWAAVAARSDLKKEPARVFRLKMLKWSSAAAILLLLAGAVWLLREKPAHENPQVAKAAVEKILPGGNKAILQLGDGQVLSLDPASADTVLDDEGAQIRHQQGNLVYHATPVAEGEVVQYNILRTPNGGQFKLVLADGTAVWLNASSSLRFPTAFTGDERIVELSGEGYFEVARNEKQPFRVKVNGAEIQVLGTHFNIMGYEGITKATLTEGAIRMQAGKEAKALRPGQQAVLKGDGGITVGVADIEKALAWRNGLFYFRNDDMTDVMEQVARWYDVKIQVKGKPSARLISGNIRRQADLAQVLDMLNFVSGATFKLEGRTVTVTFPGSTI